MKRCRRRLVWVALWMAVIFLFSAQTSQRSKELSGAVMEQLTTQQTDAPSTEETPEQEFLHTLIRKGAHFAEYAVLSMLVAYAIWDLDLPKKVRWQLPVAVSALYAVTDEVHQYFVPGRACRLGDMAIDTLGAISGMAFLAALVWLWKKIGNKKACC